MTHGASEDEMSERAALYSLGALDLPEARMFEQHISDGCELCEAEFKSYESVVERLGLDAPELEPSPAVRERLMRRIRHARWQARFVGIASARTYYPWSIAAVLAVFFLFAFIDFERIARRQTEELEQLRGELRQQRQITNELEQINTALTSPGSRVISLAGQQAAPNSSTKIYWDAHNNLWVIATDLPPPPDGKVYQLWLITKSEKLSAGLIKQSTSGRGLLVVQLPGDMSQVIAAAITLEPTGGSLQPTMPLYAAGNITS